MSVADALKALEVARANCIARLKDNGDYRAALAAEADAKAKNDSAADEDKAVMAEQLLAAHAAVHKIELAAFALDKDVIQAQRNLDAAREADAQSRARTAEADAEAAHARAEESAPRPIRFANPDPDSVAVGMTLADVQQAMADPGHESRQTADEQVYEWYSAGIGREHDPNQLYPGEQINPNADASDANPKRKPILTVIVEGGKVVEVDR